MSNPKIAKTHSEILKADFRKTFSKVKCKTLIIWGADDETFPVSDVAKIARSIPNCRILVVEGTHDWHLIFPERFYRSVISFIMN